MEIIATGGVPNLAERVLLGRRVLAICLEELEWQIREEYTDRMPTKRTRIRGYVKKHICKLRQRDPLFEEYFRVLMLADRAQGLA